MLLTKNKQDAEDALQQLELYRLTNELKQEHAVLKAINLAKNEYKRYKKHCNVQYEPDSYGFRTDKCFTEEINAKEAVDKIFPRLTASQQVLLQLFLNNDCNVIDSAKNSNYHQSSFKVLIHTLKKQLNKQQFT